MYYTSNPCNDGKRAFLIQNDSMGRAIKGRFGCEDEALHAHRMVRAAESLKSEGSEPTGVLELDHGLCERIEKRFLESRGRLATGKIE